MLLESPVAVCVPERHLLSISCRADQDAAGDKVTFTAGKKPSRLEVLMSKEEAEEEQRSVHAHHHRYANPLTLMLTAAC